MKRYPLNLDPKKRDPFPAKKTFLTAAVLVALALLLGPTSAQTQHKNDARSSAPTNVQLELVRTETGFFEAWKTSDQAYFREHMPENGIFWSDNGTLSRDQQLADSKLPRKPAPWKVTASPTSERSRWPPAHTCLLTKPSSTLLATEKKRRST